MSSSKSINQTSSMDKQQQLQQQPSPLCVCVLGEYYESLSTPQCRCHAESFFRFTYRKDFPPLVPYSISSDTGWGCMLRAAQMMMGYTMRRHYLGTEWRLPKNRKAEHLRMSHEYRHVLNNFTDFKGYPHCYALHHLVQSGMKYDKIPGEWYGPSTAALILRDLAQLHRTKYNGPFAVMVTQGDTMYITEAEKLCCDHTLDENPAAWLVNGAIGEVIDEQQQKQQQQVFEDEVSAVAAVTENNLLSAPPPPPASALPLATTQAASPHTTSAPSSSATIPAAPLAVLEPLKAPTSDEDSSIVSAAIGRSADAADDTLHTNNRYQNDQLLGRSPRTPSLRALRAGAGITSKTSVQNVAALIGGGASGNSRESLRAGGDNTLIKQAQAAAAAEQRKKRQREEEAATALAKEAALVKDPFFDPLLRPPPSALSPWTHPLMVIMPLMLGVHSVNAEYNEELMFLFQNKNCIGMLGGKPNYARFFVGYHDRNKRTAAAIIRAAAAKATAAVFESTSELMQSVSQSSSQSSSSGGGGGGGAGNSSNIPRGGSKNVAGELDAGEVPVCSASYARNVDLLGLDPHTTFPNPTVNVLDVCEFPTPEHVSQVHVSEFDILPLNQLDPSVSIGFYFENREDFESFTHQIKERNRRNRELDKAILFDVQHAPPTCGASMMAGMDDDCGDDEWGGGTGGSGRGGTSATGGGTKDEDEDDEYVFL